MLKRVVLLATVLSTGWVSCQPAKVLVTGKVERVVGNQMPSPDIPSPSFSGISVPIYFFEPLDRQKVTPGAAIGEYSSVSVQPLYTLQSSDDGQFKVKLPAGRYTVLMGKNGGFYSTIFDLDGTIHPVVVEKGKKNYLVLRADWEAIY